MDAEASVVDQHVDWHSGFFEASGDSRNVIPIGKIRRYRFDGATHRAQLGRHLGQPILRPGDEHQIVATRSKLPGERGTNARRSPRYESYTHGHYDTVPTGNPVTSHGVPNTSKGLKS
jgi:hypothetical protein